MYREREEHTRVRSFEYLTPREKEVLYLTARGLSSKEIAGKLIVSERTVEVHQDHIRGKFDVDSITQAVFRTIEKGGLSLEQITQDLDSDQIKSIDSLTPRELEALKLFTINGGMGNKQIAYEMKINTRTVEVYFASIFGKLSIEDESKKTWVGGRILAGVIYLSYLSRKG